jgi:triphosphatase
MNQETEIKLRVSRATLLALHTHPLLKKRSKNGWQTRELYNQYYDTEARDLAQAKVALRLRRDGEHLIQTLKSRGHSIAGLSARNEWDWHLNGPHLDLDKLDDSCWPASLNALDKQQLKPIFSTDFLRQSAEIAWGRGKTRVVIEAALDLGQVVAGDQQEEICELELELRQGEPAALLQLAGELALDLPLMPCDISKAERGYRLFDANSYTLTLPAPRLHAETPLDEAIPAIGWYLLGSSQRLAEQYRHSGHWRLLQDWCACLVDLRALLGSLGQAAPRSSSRELRQRLDALLNDWRPCVYAGASDERARQEAPARFARELENTRWGLLSLQASSWLLARQWAQQRTPRGDRQGAAALQSWLPTFFAEAGQALQLKRYQQHAQDLNEQLPRLERVLLWLHLAREILALNETDRLFGELSKLAELARGPLDDERLDARMSQTQRVMSLKPWKSLIGQR